MSEIFGVREAFAEIFAAYNASVWPMQIITYALGIAAVILAVKKTSFSDRIISGILAFLWLWAGIVWSLMFFCPYKFVYCMAAVMLVVQGLLLFMFGFGVGLRPSLSFKFRGDSYSIIGGLAILYVLVLYPIIGGLSGWAYPQGPIFGVAPCPVCVFTFGMLLLADKRVPVPILIIPLLWSLLGVAAARRFGIYADLGMVVIGILATVLILYRNKASAQVPEKQASI
jgi:hypothetical protein